ncbi:hypothetical protein MNEG_4758 [Monoraphidium neglectum]|uniref:Uncharacterized protein n=1 Tax=Monoraphidium neglectum TaxID=145388 RepID=A0A0D2JX57_9CHLO|nr:hypothetical protein MNEG_4758 [Monoraphidium neglectum]KIZ03198.1 hypothetical protein MNEG_4758 [Monoraphidium neglectum]|eukprot:XP_013902217.1 hypothetical protein MNEG_4758 [Monoraphidium neglectum]
MRALRWLTGEASVLPAIKDAGAINQLVPFLSREREAAAGPEAQLEALHALYNICKFNKRVHLEVAATAGIVQHLCRFALESSPALSQQQQQQQQQPAVLDPLTGAAAAEARRAAVRGFVVPMLIGMASTSSSTRAKLWACSGLDIFLQLLGEEDSQMQVGLLRALDTWLLEDHARVEHRLVAPQAVGQLVELFATACRQRDMATMPQMLDSLKLMLSRSSKLSVAMATGGLVPPLLEPLASPPGGGAPILRARLLEILRVLYEHHPRPKEFIMKFRIQDVLRRLLESEGRGEDAVKLEAQKLLNAFHINVLL